MPVVLGVDSSTQSSKVERRDAESGALLGEGRAPHPADHATPQRAGSGRVVGRAATSRRGAAGARDVDAVSVAGQQHGMVVLDDAGAVVRPAKLWNDTESAPDAAWLVKQLGGPEAWVAACGSVPLAAFTIAKLSWLHRSEPDAWARLARVCLPHDWLTLRLSGEFVTDRGDASGTGYFNPAEEQYRLDLLAVVDDALDWASRLPRVLGPRCPRRRHEGVRQGSDRRRGHRRQHGRRARRRPRRGRRRRVDRDVGNGLRGERHADRRRNRRGRVVRGRDRTLPSVGVHAERDEGHRRGGAAARRRRGRTRRARARGARRRCRRRCRAPVVVPYFDGERVPNRPDATGVDRRVALRRDARSIRVAPRSTASCAVCSTVSTRSPRPACPRAVASCSSAAVPGRLPTGARSRTSPAARCSCRTRRSTSPPARACRRPRRCWTCHRRRSRPPGVWARARSWNRERDRSGRDPGALLGGGPRVASRHAS